MYKKLLLVVLSVITLQTVKAQTEKGNQTLGINLGLATKNSTMQDFDPATNAFGYKYTGKETSYSIGPSYSYFVADKLDLGASFNYGHYKLNYDPASDVRFNQLSKSYGASVFLRKYFLYDNKVGVRTGPYLYYQKTKQDNTYADSQNNFKNDVSELGTGLGLDFVYFPAKNIGLAASLANLGYAHNKTTGYQQITSNSFNFSVVNNINLSVYYVFGK